MPSASHWITLVGWVQRAVASNTTLMVMAMLGAVAVALAMVFSNYAVHFKSDATELHLNPPTSTPPEAPASGVTAGAHPTGALER